MDNRISKKVRFDIVNKPKPKFEPYQIGNILEHNRKIRDIVMSAFPDDNEHVNCGCTRTPLNLRLINSLDKLTLILNNKSPDKIKEYDSTIILDNVSIDALENYINLTKKIYANIFKSDNVEKPIISLFDHPESCEIQCFVYIIYLHHEINCSDHDICTRLSSYFKYTHNDTQKLKPLKYTNDFTPFIHHYHDLANRINEIVHKLNESNGVKYNNRDEMPMLNVSLIQNESSNGSSNASNIIKI